MKTNKASLLLPLLTIVYSLSLGGCYTQLAFVNDQQNAAAEPFPDPPFIIIIQPILQPIIYPQPAPPIMNPLPPVWHSPEITQTPPQQQPRDFGYQRPSQSDNNQTTIQASDPRPSGSIRGGR
jgi:hypothetical protein